MGSPEQNTPTRAPNLPSVQSGGPLVRILASFVTVPTTEALQEYQAIHGGEETLYKHLEFLFHTCSLAGSLLGAQEKLLRLSQHKAKRQARPRLQLGGF